MRKIVVLSSQTNSNMSSLALATAAASYVLVRASVDLVKTLPSQSYDEPANKITTQPLSVVLHEFHAEARRKSLTLERIQLNRYRCDELYSLHRHVEDVNETISMRQYTHWVNMAATEREIQSTARQQSRSAMLRHGFIVDWLEAVVDDDMTDHPLTSAIALGGICAALLLSQNGK